MDTLANDAGSVARALVTCRQRCWSPTLAVERWFIRYARGGYLVVKVTIMDNYIDELRQEELGDFLDAVEAEGEGYWTD